MTTEKKGWVESAAKAISVLTHPIFVPLYGLLLLYSAPTLLSYMPFHLKKIVLVLVIADDIFLPLSMAAILYSRGTITSIYIRERNERNFLLTFCLVMYAVTAFLVVKIPVASLFKAYFISVAIVTLVTLIINFFYRISLHAVGIGGLLALMVCMVLIFNIVYVQFIALLVLLSGAVLTSRLYLEEHKPSEAWLGLLVGTGVTGLTLLLFLS
jgi:hypothetical protein